MRAHNVQSYLDYLAILERHPDEYQKLADALTINVTKFFRNAELWDRLRQGVMPELWQRARQGQPVRLWSAGCASGEEPYSIAMMLAEQAGGSELSRIVIDASDIDRVCLERARVASYPLGAFSETPPAMLERYTEPEGNQRRVCEPLRGLVRVGRLDLTREGPPGAPYDLIMCRNVLIYFDRAMQERLFAMFADALRPGGYLVLGKVETILGPTKDRLELTDVRERIYRRPA